MKVTEDSFSTENTDSVNNTLGYSKYGHYIVKKELEINLPNTAIKFSHHSKNKFSYHRTNSESEDVHKIIAVKSEPLQIELIPSLPLHLPAYKTDFVFLRFINKLFLSANSSTEVVVPFPIELAICITENNTTDYLDFFTCDGSNSRYGLYGSPEEGKLCKYARIPWEYNENVSYFRYAKMKIT
ncbi:MAG TPA: DUF432 domain-containing protein, partial [Nitrosopumilaceae archaeon]|nr:DUF432 domain-containing protein [Nitrosopumilaceae archaeon]